MSHFLGLGPGKGLREEGEKQHKAGNHGESMKALGEAKKILGI